MIDRRLLQNFDWPLLALILLIAGIGIVNLYSAGYNHTPDRVTPVYVKQGYWLMVGLSVMLVTLTIDYRYLERLAYPLYILSIILLIAVMVGGKTVSGSKRWLGVGPIAFQPSELVKIALILVLARYFHRLSPQGPLPFKDILPPLALILIPAAIIVKQPDLGSAILVILVGGSMILLVGVNWRVLLIGGLALFTAIPATWPFLKEYQRQRVRTFLNPEQDPLGAGYHIIQSKIAVGSGGLFGKGWLNGTQSHLDFLPERKTDFIFPVFSEEFGFIGSLLLLAIYAAIIIRGLMIALQAQDSYTRLLAGSITLTFFIYVFINIGMVSGLLPVVGIPLPLVSYGGTSMVTLLTGFGILMSIQTHRKLIST